MTAYLRIPGLPQAFVAPNEPLGITSQRGWDPWKHGGTMQTFVLSRGAQLLAFGFNGGRTLPMLEAFGVTVTDGGSPCRVEGCARAVRDTRVTVGDVQAIVGQSQTVQVGDVSFTVEQHSFPQTSSLCDGVYDLRMAGYRVPPTPP